MTYEELARHFGFTDDHEMHMASEEVIRQGDVSWFITRLPDGRWAAWDDAEIALDRIAYFATREEAERFHREAYEGE